MQAPSWLTAQLIVSVVTNIIIVHVILVTCAYLIYLERKISAYIQDRIGPNRVGFDFGLPALAKLKGALGLGQSLADGLKFILKEDYTPNRVDKVMFTLAPGIIIVPALIGFIIIPWGGTWHVDDFTIPLINMTIAGGDVRVSGANINIGIVYLLAVASLGVYGVALGGWASNNKYSFLGGLRATAQMISYEIPLGLALLATLLLVGSVYPESIVRHQVNHSWLIFSQPLAALLFFIAIMAEANRAPFDNAEAEQELVGGYHTEYSAMRFALFFLAEYSHMVTSSAFFALLFLGGYQLIPFVNDPITSPDAVGLGAAGIGIPLLKFLVFFGKVILLIAFMMLIRWTIPRLRYDQIMTMAWQLVIPTALALVVTISVMVYLGYTQWYLMLLANVGIMALVLAAAPLFSRGPANRKVPLYGSRFSPMPGERVITAPTEPAALQEHAG
jgi:NADH-quinone oxidoreductase subunit H